MFFFKKKIRKYSSNCYICGYETIFQNKIYKMLELLRQPWHWSAAGVMIGLTVPTLLLMGNKKFGISSSLRHICAMCVPAKIPFFQYNWKAEVWNLFFVLGIFLGSVIATQLLSNPNSMQVAADTQRALGEYGITDFSQFQPVELFNWDNALTLKGFVFFIMGGFLIGFGTRYGNGCTSGHAIMGLSNLQWPSLVATICFMAGGFLCTHLLFPLIFKLF